MSSGKHSTTRTVYIDDYPRPTPYDQEIDYPPDPWYVTHAAGLAGWAAFTACLAVILLTGWLLHTLG